MEENRPLKCRMGTPGWIDCHLKLTCESHLSEVASQPSSGETRCACLKTLRLPHPSGADAHSPQHHSETPVVALTHTLAQISVCSRGIGIHYGPGRNRLHAKRIARLFKYKSIET